MAKSRISIILLILGLSQAATAANYHHCGAYLGAQIGGGNLHYQGTPLARDAVSVDDSGFAGRLLAGFDINQNVAFELGFTLYQNPEFKYRGGVSSGFTQNSVDFLTKLSVPVSCDMSLYAKAGLAYVYRGDARVVDHNVTTQLNESDQHLRPMLGLGVSYAFNARMSGDLGYFRTFGTEDLQDADFYGAGLTVRIG